MGRHALGFEASSAARAAEDQRQAVASDRRIGVVREADIAINNILNM